MKTFTLQASTYKPYNVSELTCLNDHCMVCGNKMNLSISMTMDQQLPLQFWWICASCNGEAKRVLQLSVPGASRADKLASIYEIVKEGVFPKKISSANEQSVVVMDLFKVVAREGIRLSYLDFSSTPTVRSVYFKHDGVPFIILDESLKADPAEHRAFLAVELGHHFAGTNTDSFQGLDEMSKLRDEVTALRWAVKLLASSQNVWGRAG